MAPGKKRYQIGKYLLLYMILFEAGTPIQTAYPRVCIVGIFLIAIIVLLYKHKILCRRGKVFTFAVGFMILTNLLNLDVYFSTVIMILMVMFSALAFSEIYTRLEFENIYAELMAFLAAVSILFYIIGLLFPGFVKALPVFHGSNGDYPIVLGLFFYPCGSNQYLSTLNRNNGLFREMGLFALLLIWALCIMLQEENNNRFSLRQIFIIIIALITTFSTTGIIALAVLLPVIIKQCRIKGLWKRIGALKYVIYMLGIVAFGVVTYQGKVLLFGKLNPNNADYASFLSRYDGLMKDISLFIHYPWGSGPTRYASENLGGANSISYFMACFGLTTTLLVFVGFFLFITDLRYTKNRLIFVLGAAALVMMTQGVSDYVIFYMFVMYGYSRHKKTALNKKAYETKKGRNDQLFLQRI